MDFSFSEEENKFREEVREFFQKRVPREWPHAGTFHSVNEEEHKLRLVLQKEMGQRGWLALTWPRKYGGSEKPHMYEVILSDELAYYGAPGWDVFGSAMFGPTLLKFGTEEQKLKYLPPIARGEVIWGQGFTEPGAGSDLASLQTKAVDKGDHFLVNGQKIFNTEVGYSDWLFFLTRTDPSVPKHKGISFLFADRRNTPGITVRPLINLTGRGEFYEIFFDDARIPKTNVVGEVNKGWYVAAALLDFERSGIRYVAIARRLLDGIVEYVKHAKCDGKPSAENPVIRQELAERATEIEISRMLSYRVAWMQSKGLIPNYEASLSKVFGSELIQRTANTGVRVMGLYGQLEHGSRHVPGHGLVEHQYLAILGQLIAAGTSEVQRMIIATRGLGLPKD